MFGKYFGDREFIMKLIHIALPMAMQSVINMFVNMIDTIMVGTLGDIALSSVNLSGQFPYLSVTVFMGIANAGLVVAAQAWGNKKKEKAKSVLAYCLRISFLPALLFFLAGFFFPGRIISIYTNSAEIIETGAVYLKILSLTMFLNAYTQVIVIMLRCAGVNRLGFYASTIACFSNVFFNWLLIFGHLGAPRLGIMGAAVATVIARVIEGVIVISYLLVDKKMHFRLSDLFMKMDDDLKQDYWKGGRPLIISEVTQNLNVSAAAMITGRVSSYYIAANTIVHNIWTISSLFMFGMAMGANVMIGHAIGANEKDTAKQYTRYFVHIAILIGAVGALMTQILAPIITSFFRVSPEAIETAGILKNAASVAVFFLAIQVVLTKGILRGGGQASAVTKVDLASCWLVNIPLGYFVALVLKANPFFIYLSLRTDYLIKTVWGLKKISGDDWMIRMRVD